MMFFLPKIILRTKFAMLMLATLLFAAPPLAAAIAEATATGIPIMYQADSEARIDFTAFVGSLDHELNRLLRRRAGTRNRIPVRIEVAGATFPELMRISRNGDTATLIFSADFADFYQNYYPARNLAAFLALAKIGIRPEIGIAKFPPFIADGMVDNAIRRRNRDSLLNINYYPGIRAVLSSGGKYDLEQILQAGDDAYIIGGAALDFYYEAARFALDILYANSGATSPLIEDFMVLSIEGSNFHDTFNATFIRAFTEPPPEASAAEPPAFGAAEHIVVLEQISRELPVATTPEERLAEYIHRRVFTTFQPYNAAEQIRRYLALRSFEYELTVNGEEQTLSADLINLPDLYAKYSECRLIPGEIQAKIVHLANAAGPLTSPKLVALAEAVGEIGAVSTRASSAKLAIALTDLDRALNRLAAVEAPLIETEMTMASLPAVLPNTFTSAQESTSELTPKITAFLTKIEDSLSL